MTDETSRQEQNRDVEKQLSGNFNGKGGFVDGLFNEAHNRWLETFKSSGSGPEEAFRTATEECLKGTIRTYSSLGGYIDAKNNELRDLARQNELKDNFDIELDGLATAKVRALDRKVRMIEKEAGAKIKKNVTPERLNREDLEIFTTILLTRLPMAVDVAKDSMKAAIRDQKDQVSVGEGKFTFKGLPTAYGTPKA